MQLLINEVMLRNPAAWQSRSKTMSWREQEVVPSFASSISTRTSTVRGCTNNVSVEQLFTTLSGIVQMGFHLGHRVK